MKIQSKQWWSTIPISKKKNEGHLTLIHWTKNKDHGIWRSKSRSWHGTCSQLCLFFFELLPLITLLASSNISYFIIVSMRNILSIIWREQDIGKPWAMYGYLDS
jgi:hypothetical protein